MFAEHWQEIAVDPVFNAVDSGLFGASDFDAVAGAAGLVIGAVLPVEAPTLISSTAFWAMGLDLVPAWLR